MSEKKTIKKSFKSPFANPLKQNNNEENKFLNETKKKNNIQHEGKMKHHNKFLCDKKKVENNEHNPTKNNSREVKKRPTISLTDEQYEDIFTSAINRTLTEEFPVPEENSSDEDIENEVVVPEPNKAQSPHEGAKEPIVSPISVKHLKKHTSKHNANGEKKQDSITKKKRPVLKVVKPFLSVQAKIRESYTNTKNMKSKVNAVPIEQPEKNVSSSQTQGSQNSHSGNSCKKQQNMSQESSHSQQNSQSQRSQLPFSQPAPHLSLKDRLLWLQQRRDVGLWVQCSRPVCNKWRYLKDVRDPTDIPTEWFCHMNSDKRYNNCSKVEKPPTAIEEEDLIHNLYTAGSIVWGRLDGYPWWPAMVDDCPDTEQYYWLNGFSDIPTYYNVVFFDEKEVTRAWLTPGKMKPFKGTETSKEFRKTTANGIDYAKRINFARQLALEALPMSISERLKTFSFLSRHKGPFGTLKSERVQSKKRKHTDKYENGNEKCKQTNQIVGNHDKRRVAHAVTYNGKKLNSSHSELVSYQETNPNTASGASKNTRHLHFSNASLYTQAIDSRNITSKGTTKNRKLKRSLEYREFSSSDEEMVFSQRTYEINSSQDLFQSEGENEKENEDGLKDGKEINEISSTSSTVQQPIPNENKRIIEDETLNPAIQLCNTENYNTRTVIGPSKLDSCKKKTDDYQLSLTSSVTLIDETTDDSTKAVVGRNRPELQKTKGEYDSVPTTSSNIYILEGERNKQDDIVSVQKHVNEAKPKEIKEMAAVGLLLPEINNSSQNNQDRFRCPERNTPDTTGNENGILLTARNQINNNTHSEDTVSPQEARENGQAGAGQPFPSQPNLNSNSQYEEVQSRLSTENRADSNITDIENNCSQAREIFAAISNENVNSQPGQSTDNTISTIFHINSGNFQDEEISINVSNVTVESSSSADMLVLNTQNNIIQSTRSQNTDAVVPQLNVDEDSDDFEIEE